MERVRGFVRSVARRLGTRALLDACGTWLSIGAGAAAGLLAAERLVSLGASAGLLVAVPILAAGLASVAAGLARWPGTHAAAVAADAQLGLQERLSSALAAGTGPMAEALRSDAKCCVAALNPRRQFPVCVPERFRWLALCAVGLLVAALMPTLDLFGWGAARAARAAERSAVRQSAATTALGLGKLAGAGRRQGIERTPEALDQMGKQLEGLAAGDPTAEKAREAVQKMLKDLDSSKAANADTLNQSVAPKERRKGEAERDLLLSTERLLEGWERELAGLPRGGVRPAPGKATDDTKGKEPARATAPEFVRPQETPVVPRETVKVESRLLATRPAAEAATSREDVPPPYRAIVRRYFSPGDRE